MQVYGDRSTPRSPADGLTEISRTVSTLADMPAGVARHARLTRQFIVAAGLVQGLADAAFQRDGVDEPSPEVDALMATVMDLARAVLRSWDSGFSEAPGWVAPLFSPGCASISVREPEGYAYYGVYPEAYGTAAAALRDPARPARVIGLRSIGTGLAAIVAARVDAPPPLTVRPVGHPFAREVRLGEGALDDLIGEGRRYVIVDEGPGLSGSSFAAVAEVLLSCGVPSQDIVFMPSHSGPPGPEASPRTRFIWSSVRICPADSGTLVPDSMVARWCETLIGPVQSFQDVGAGRWRSLRDQADTAVDPRTERRKLLLRTGDCAWLAKFSGLSEAGGSKLDRGRRLADAGLVPSVAGMAHGFIVQQWIEPDRSARGPDLAEIAAYLGTRSRVLAEPERRGASLGELAEMAAANTREELGASAAHALRRRLAAHGALADLSRPMHIDGKCDRHEWIRDAGGRLLKADALDHSLDHDLVGPQDLAWDVSGAAVEFGLGEIDTETLRERTERQAGRPVHRTLMTYLRPCYLAFRLGAARLAQRRQGWDDAARSGRTASLYAKELAEHLRG